MFRQGRASQRRRSAALPPLRVASAPTLLLPELQLTGSLSMAVPISASSLVLPQLQLSGSFTRAVGPLGAWYRKASSTPDAGTWNTVVDVLGGASGVQSVVGRRLAASTSANGYPIGIHSGASCWRMPLSSNNFNASTYGVAQWIRLAGTGAQYFFAIYNNDATVRVLTWGVTSSGKLWCEIYIGTNVDGRYFETANGAIVAGAYQFPRLQIDMTKTAERDADGSTADAKVRFFVGEVARPIVTATNIGVGGTLSALRTPNLSTGAAIWGAVNDAASPLGAIDNLTREGPNTYVYTGTPSTTQAANVMNLEIPT